MLAWKTCPFRRRGSRAGRGAVIAVALLAVLVSACASSSRAGDGPGEPEHRQDTELRVTNHNWADMTVYVVRPGTRPVRLGLVTSMKTVMFEMPGDFVGTGRDVHLLADPVGGLEPYVSERFQVFPGDRIEWRLQNRLEQSALLVF